MTAGKNAANARVYATKLRKYARNYARDYLVPFLTTVIKQVVMRAADVTPYNLGTLRGMWMVTVDGSGRLPKSPDLQDIEEMVLRNLKKWRLGQEVAIENDAPHAEKYEYGGFNPANPAYKEIGGSLALHVPVARRSEKRGKVLIVGGYNVTAPRGMVAEGLDYVNTLAAATSGPLSRVITL